MNYSLKKYIPKQLNISYKINNQTLVNDITEQIPVQDKHILKTTDIYQIENKINEIKDYLNILLTYNNNQFLKFHQNIPEFIKNILLTKKNRVLTYNEKTNCSVNNTQNISLNLRNYKYTTINKGCINVGNYVSGLQDDFVLTYNGNVGNVFGLSSIILNDTYISPDQNGIIYINEIIEKPSAFVTTFNDKSGIIENALSGIISGIDEDESIIFYDDNNKGVIQLSPIIDKICNTKELVEQYKILLYHPSAITLTENDDKYQVATTDYIKKIKKQITGVKNISFSSTDWVYNDTSGKYQLNIETYKGLALLHIYKYENEWLINYTNCDVEIITDETDQKFLSKIILRNNESFTGNITLLQIFDE